METVKNNIFNMLNKGERALLFETGLLVQQMQLSDCGEAAMLFEKMRELLKYHLARTAHIEKTIFGFVPATESKALELVKQQYAKLKTAAENLLRVINRFDENSTGGEVNIFGTRLTDLFYDFSGDCLQFLNSEEKTLKQILAKNYEDEGLCALGRELLCNIGMEIKPTVFKYIIRGTSDAEITRLLNAAKLVAPASELEQLMCLAETELPEKRWLRVQEGLADGLCL